MADRVIHWRLKEVMDRHSIRAKDLADEIKVSQNSVSNLRGADMPRLDGDKLNALVLGLNRLRRADSELITPSDLIQFSLSPDEMQRLGVK